MLLPFVALKSFWSRTSAPFSPLYLSTSLPLLISLILVLFVIPSSMFAQDATDDDDVVRVNTDLLVFPVRISDKKGQAVTGLKVSDLSLKDDDHITAGLYFSEGVDRVALLFALDQSGSLREVITQQQDAAMALFERFGERSSIAILRFAERPAIAVPFQKDIATARAGFRFHAASNARTAIFDAAAKAISEFDQLPRTRAERRIVVLISDGLDNSSRTSPTQVIKDAVDRRVSFYVIHLPLFEPRDGRLMVRTPSKGFRELAEKTGGKYFLAGDSQSALNPRATNLTPIFDAIDEDLRSQYLLGFYLDESAKDGRKHVFSLSLMPRDIRYSVGQLGYSNTHKFFVNLAPGSSTLPR